MELPWICSWYFAMGKLESDICVKHGFHIVSKSNDFSWKIKPLIFSEIWKTTSNSSIYHCRTHLIQKCNPSGLIRMFSIITIIMPAIIRRGGIRFILMIMPSTIVWFIPMILPAAVLPTILPMILPTILPMILPMMLPFVMVLPSLPMMILPILPVSMPSTAASRVCAAASSRAASWLCWRDSNGGRWWHATASARAAKWRCSRDATLHAAASVCARSLYGRISCRCPWNAELMPIWVSIGSIVGAAVNPGLRHLLSSVFRTWWPAFWLCFWLWRVACCTRCT